jgi:hypothetical protein
MTSVTGQVTNECQMQNAKGQVTVESGKLTTRRRTWYRYPQIALIRNNS